MLPSDNDQLLSWSQLETARQERDAALQGEATANRLLEHHRARADQAEREFAQATIDIADEMTKVKRLRAAFEQYLNSHCEYQCEQRSYGCLCGRMTEARRVLRETALPMVQRTIQPIEVSVRLKVRADRLLDDKAKTVALRWLDRNARRNHRFANRPSLLVQIDRDPSLRQSFLRALVYTVPDDSPPWLADAVVHGETIHSFE